MILIPKTITTVYNRAVHWSRSSIQTIAKEKMRESEKEGNIVNTDSNTMDSLCALLFIIMIFCSTFLRAFHKINSDFFDLEVTCAFHISDRIMRPFGTEGRDLPLTVQQLLPALVIAMELVPALFFGFPKCQTVWSFLTVHDSWPTILCGLRRL